MVVVVDVLTGVVVEVTVWGKQIAMTFAKQAELETTLAFIVHRTYLSS